jgi:glycosyltransferase involved in cell wall biosynthesis
MPQTPKVSVCVITYNQERYIRECLQSLVDQETDFEFEVIVGDDCSTDDTPAIVREFANRYPAVIRALFQEENTGGTKNYLDVHGAATGEYVAHMDGDDLALPGKLQKQADFLDQHTNCSFVCHAVAIISEDGAKTLGINPEAVQPVFSDIDRLVRNYIFFIHSSKMYRRSANVFEHSRSHAQIDFFFHIEHASLGEIGFLSEILGCQRVTTHGITSAKGEKLRVLLDLTIEAFDRALQLGVREEVVNYGKSRYLVGAALVCLSHGDVDGYSRYLTASRINGRYFSVAHALMCLLNSCRLHPPLTVLALVRRWRKWRRLARPAGHSCIPSR